MGDYQVKEMDAVLNRRPGIERLYRSVRQFASGKKGMVYAISIEHARRIAEYYSRRGVNAVAVDSKTPAMERKRMVEEFRHGKNRGAGECGCIQRGVRLSRCGVCTTGPSYFVTG